MKGGFGEEVGTVEFWPDIGGGWGTRRYPRGVWLAPVTQTEWRRVSVILAPDRLHTLLVQFCGLPVTSPPSFVHLLSRAFVLSGLLDDSCTVARINCSCRN